MGPNLAAHHQLVEELRAGLSRVLRGKGPVVDLALIGIFAGGHVLLEDVPGVGKTTLAKALARVFGVRFTRVQFTPDLLPGDITGSLVLDPEKGTFSFHRGPDTGRAPRGHERVPGDGRGRNPPARGAVLRRRDAEPGGLSGHLPASRGPARPLPRPHLDRVPEPAGRARDALRAADPGSARRADRAVHPAEPRFHPGGRPQHRGEAARGALPACDRRGHAQRSRAQSRRQSARIAVPLPSGAGARVHARPRLREPRGREGDRRRDALPSRGPSRRGPLRGRRWRRRRGADRLHRPCAHVSAAPSWRARLGAVNWQRLNYVLIPAARSRKPIAEPFGEPSSRRGRWLFRLYRAFTPEGRWLFVIALVTGAFAVDVTHTQVYLLFSLLASVILASLLVSPSLRLPGR